MKVYSREHIMLYCALYTMAMLAEGDRILILPFPWPSHYNSLEKIGVELAKRGHQVTLLMPSTENYTGKTILNTTIYQVPNLPANTFVKIAENRLESGKGFGVSWLVEYIRLLGVFGEALLQDQEIARMATNADLLLSDTAFLTASIFSGYHKLPCVFVSPFGHLPGCMADVLGITENPSYVPTFVATTLFERIGFPQRMNFFERSFNVLANILSKILRHFVTVEILRPLTERYSSKSLLTLWQETSLVLIPMDYSLEFPRPDPPHVKIIGPLTPTDNQLAIPQPFSSILEHAVQRVIVVSFGITNSLHPKYVSLIARELLKLKYTVIWRYNSTKLENISGTHGHLLSVNKSLEKQSETESRCNETVDNGKRSWYTSGAPTSQQDTTEVVYKLGENLHVFDWLPQQELIQDKRTVLLISHCGINSVYEALYHSTPVLCIPLFGEQFDNAGRVTSRKVGKAMTLHDLTKESLEHTINDLINDGQYKSNAIKASRRLRRSTVSAVEKAAYWIEAVLDEQGDMSYLRPTGSDMSYFVYFSIDIFLCWSAILIGLPSILTYWLIKKRNK